MAFFGRIYPPCQQEFYKGKHTALLKIFLDKRAQENAGVHSSNLQQAV